MATVNPILEISDGTTTINLIDNTSGFGLVDWTPKIAELKGGGTFASSNLSDGRSLVSANYENVVETFNLRVRGFDQDAVAANLRQLRQLLEKARNYWISDWTTEPVWIKVKGPQESLPRYSVIYNWSTPQDDNPFVMPLFNCKDALGDEFTLLIERSPFWVAQQPPNDSTVDAAVTYEWQGSALGNVDEDGILWPSSDRYHNRVYVANKYNEANITHVYLYEAGVGWSGNLQTGSLPHYIMPNSAGVGDILYIGIQTAIVAATYNEIEGAGPFSNVVFNLSREDAGIIIKYEYWDGSSWVQFIDNPFDNFNLYHDDKFVNPRGDIICFLPPKDWQRTTLSAWGGDSSVEAYWIRLRITSGSGYGAIQDDQHIYSVTKPYVEVQNDQIGGDIPALLRIYVHNKSDNYEDSYLWIAVGVIAQRKKTRNRPV